MNNHLRKQLLMLHQTKQIALDKLKNLPMEDHNRSKVPGKWTPAQVVYHLILGEELTAAYIKLKVQDPSTLDRSGIKSKIKSIVLNLALKSRRKFKAPEFTAKVPDYVTYQELSDRWEKAQLELKSIVDKLPVDLLDKNIFKHPVIGRINIYQTLSFLRNHIIHHLPQIR